MTTAIVPYQDDSGLLAVVDLYDIVAQAGVPFLHTNIQPAARPTAVVVSGVFSGPGVLSVVVTKDGIERTMQLNSGVALRAGCLYSFSHIVSEGEEINYMYSADCTVDLFKVQAVTPQQAGISTSNVYDIVTTALMLTAMMAFGMMLMKSIRT